LKHKLGITIGLLAATGLTVGAFYSRRGNIPPDVTTVAVSRGTITSEIAATGTLEAVTTVEVGTQVSGTIQALYADFNSIVKKGQVVARLDPSLFQTQVESARANVTSAKATVQRYQVALNDAQTKATRAHELFDKQLIATTDLNDADVAVKLAAAQLQSSQAQLAQAQAALTQAEVNVEKTVITSPIDGIVIGRNVDVGQTVAASFQAPTLFTLAADLSQMQVKANIDESDLGNVRNGQDVSFRVDAYPNKTFHGTVKQIRLNPVVEQNVVTYAAIVSAPNPALELKPGMTANITIEVARRENVLRVPAAALRFRPTDEMLAALGETPEPAVQPGGHAAKPGTGTVWVYDGGLHPAKITTGITDGQFTEVTGGSLSEGSEVVTRVAQPGTTSTSASNSSNPLMPQTRRRF
jgi:HlyD family secretion protein